MTLQSRIVARTVKMILEKDVASIIAIINKISSPRKVARRLLPEIKKELGYEPSLGSIAKVIERYIHYVEKSGKLAGYDVNVLRKMIASTRVSLESDVAVFGIKIVKNIENRLLKIMQYIYSRKEKQFFHITYGHTFITLITAQENLEKILKIIGRENIIYHRKNQAALNIFTPKDILNVPGVGGYILSILGLSGINVVEILSSYNEGILILSEKDAHRGYNVLRSEIDRLRKQLK
ncbi:MAG: hypothetical protein QW423_02520 [Candidatus Aenigmatarchaeota archaeon]